MISQLRLWSAIAVNCRRNLVMHKAAQCLLFSSRRMCVAVELLKRGTYLNRPSQLQQTVSCIATQFLASQDAFLVYD